MTAAPTSNLRPIRERERYRISRRRFTETPPDREHAADEELAAEFTRERPLAGRAVMPGRRRPGPMPSPAGY
jgi:hypothetical protein